MQVFRRVHAQPSLEANTLTRPARVFTDERMPPGPARRAPLPRRRRPRALRFRNLFVCESTVDKKK
jgi:hypothetical protein